MATMRPVTVEIKADTSGFRRSIQLTKEALDAGIENIKRRERWDRDQSGVYCSGCGCEVDHYYEPSRGGTQLYRRKFDCGRQQIYSLAGYIDTGCHELE